MLKIFFRTFIVLLVAGAVAAGLYLAVENGGLTTGSDAGASFLEGEMSERPERHGFGEGEIPAGGAFARGERGPEGEAGFSMAGLSGVIAQAGKIAIITAIVVAAQSILRLIKRRLPTGSAPA